MILRKTSGILLGCVFFAATSAWAQDATPQAQFPAITVNARLVVLDVVVTDKNGKPVDGLTQKDFKVLEDGKPQTVRSFEPPSAHAEPAPVSSSQATAPLDPAHPASFGVAPVTILVLDQLNTHFADSSYARRELRDYLAKQPATMAYPATILSVYDGHFKQIQGFTQDRADLLHALEAAPVENAWQLEQNGKADFGPAERLEQSLHALQDIAQGYAGIRGRKNLVWVGGGFPTIDPHTIDGKDAQQVKDDLQHTTNLLLDTRVTLYAVDPTSSAAGMTEITEESQLQFAMMAGDALAGGADPFDIHADFDKLGPVTGGRILRGLNNIAALIADSIDLGTNYYTLTYTPSSANSLEAKYRAIQVICLRPGLKVSTRSGYYTEDPRHESSRDAIAYDLSTAAETTIPLNALHVTVEPVPSASVETGTYVIHVGASALTWEPAPNAGSVAHVAILAASVSKQNKLLAHTLHGMTASVHPGVNVQDPALKADFEFTVKTAPHASVLRFVVRDAATGRMGSFDLPVKQ